MVTGVVPPGRLVDELDAMEGGGLLRSGIAGDELTAGLLKETAGLELVALAEPMIPACDCIPGMLLRGLGIMGCPGIIG